MLQIPVVLQSRVRIVQTVQKPEMTTGACAGPDSAVIRRDFAVLDKAVGMPLVCRNCGGLQFQFIDSLVHVPAVMQRLVPDSAAGLEA